MIEVKKKLVYGRFCYYPMNDLAKAICEGMRKKVFSDKQMEVFEKYGIKVIRIRSYEE